MKLNGKHLNASLTFASGDHWKRVRFKSVTVLSELNQL